MLPRSHLRFGSFEFSRELVPSTFLSGDFVDAFAIDQGRWGFYLADVAGHGVSSALVTVLLRTFVHRQLDDHARGRDESILHPATLLEHLNEEISRDDLDKHLTIFYGVIDVTRDSLVYANAGHFPWPLLFDGHRTITLEQPAVPIGLMPGVHYREERLALPDELVLAAFSDGLLEVLPQHDLAAKDAYLRALFGRLEVTVEGVKETLHVDEHSGLPDDVAILLIKRRNDNGRAEDTTRASRLQ
jgi:serine phosphatase RsbU (regulator of sigma subunit)